MYSRQNGHGAQYPIPAPTGADGPPSQASLSMVPMAANQAAHSTTTRPYCGTKNGRTYSLKVEQEPVRARMCGFGDKDRRPITPPPCIRLIVTDAKTGLEIPFDEVESTFFVLTVDLWDAEGTQEVNLVRHSSGAPSVSISNSTTTSYPPPPERPAPTHIYMVPAYSHPYNNMQQPAQSQAVQYGAPPPMQGYGYAPPTAPANGYQYPPANNMPGYNAIPMSMAAVQPPPATATGMFTRNLIGSLSVNAFRLHDTNQKPGFWFVLQDLSVRTEGNFRLKMNFVDVGSGQPGHSLNTGRAPVLATCFSDKFQVFSAKKFPGVIESTSLSKCFAEQGIKIPIRKEGTTKLANQEEFDADE
ncbi:VeA-like protein [Lophium mytilinum]|uniref:VeA-like protein n=1 Tax=Lophium mytilinum TaxID=390894 RepID=A0A6A6R7U0_9PEZI|nr:VeA-like protein [Lophium mytilinum]